MSEQDDKTFIVHFSWIIAGLVVLTVVLVVLAYNIHGKLVPSDNPSREAQKLERIKPVAQVYAGETGRAAAAEAAAAAQTAAPAAAFDGSLDGEMIYNARCSACHALGVSGAPILGDAEQWASRMEKGVDAVIAAGINGVPGTAMVAKGGSVDLSDEQVKASVEYMLAQLP